MQTADNKQSINNIAAIMAVKEGDNLVSTTRLICTPPRYRSPELRQQTFDLEATDKNQELCNFETEVKNILWPAITVSKKARGFQ